MFSWTTLSEGNRKFIYVILHLWTLRLYTVCILLPPERNTCFILETSYLDFPSFMMSCIPFLKSSESDFTSTKEVEEGKKIFGGILETWHLSLRLVSKSQQPSFSKLYSWQKKCWPVWFATIEGYCNGKWVSCVTTNFLSQLGAQKKKKPFVIKTCTIFPS